MSELRRSRLSPLILAAYRHRHLRRICAHAIRRLEGVGGFYSATIRDVLERFHGVKVGAYSYGECMIPGAFPAGVTIGRYVSVAEGVRVFLRNHPLDRLSTHPAFYNHDLGYLAADCNSSGRLVIGHDAWIGCRAIITAGCQRVGIGAVVGAGSVLTHDVPDFAIVAGSPAHLLRMRFPDEMCRRIRQSLWWERSIEDLAGYMQYMNIPVDDRHPLLMGAEAWSEVLRR